MQEYNLGYSANATEEVNKGENLIMCCIEKKYYQYLQREHSDKFACKSWELTDFCAEPVANVFPGFSFLRQK